MKHLIIASIALMASPAFAGISLVDGDTIKIDGQTIRIVEIDTPETFQPRCEQELIKGLAAKERLRALLQSGPVTFKPTGTDRYKRTLAKVYAGKVNVGKALIAEGHALPYQPGIEAKLARLKVWCGDAASLDDSFGGVANPMPLVQQAQAQAQSEERTPKNSKVYYRNCAAARAAGAAPIRAGEPGYSRKLDRDGDGVACE
ncbi:excalibur calcium-binding domain-containing protein [Mycoplana dimorpha]|uniref:Nuclease-like protein n=1 Tax=Mycoplana dimorpha TaxID=28320 RepID=A0A2T5ATX6_MYCDI|nr:excalibur calcium-binding domain-containing protein [Mycoplana dimorpha]PTM90144.1 nuclease-like protein [Mycoplana dimorpha]